jgi:hypothetical protein
MLAPRLPAILAMTDSFDHIMLDRQAGERLISFAETLYRSGENTIRTIVRLL